MGKKNEGDYKMNYEEIDIFAKAFKTPEELEKMMDENKAIQEIIESLQGTCESLDMEEYLSKGFSEENLIETIYESIVLCES